MKSEVIPSIVEKSILNAIVEVKETLATGVARGNRNRRSFGTVDLWNIRRNTRSASAMMRI